MADIPMAGGVGGASPPAPAVAAPATASASPLGQATGPTPATVPVPNRGSEQSALLAIGMHAQQIQQLLNQLPFGGDAAQAIGEALNKIRKHVPPPGSTPPGVERAQLDQMMNAQRQNAIRMALARQQAAGAGGGGASPPLGGGMRPPPTMQ